MDRLDETACSRIDEALSTWRQGDFVLGEDRTLFRLDVDTPLTAAAKEAASEGVDTAEERVRGLVLVSHSCDIVRPTRERPFVQVCPLVEVEPSIGNQVERGRRPNRAFIPGTAEHHLVADLDRVMTLEKAVVARWEKSGGLRGDNEERRFRLALMRNRGRAAFPDDFVMFSKRLTSRLSKKHDVDSAEGRALRALREIRVRVEPSWESSNIRLVFWFIRDEDTENFEGRTWDSYVERWLELIPPQGRFAEVDGLIQTLDDISGREFVESDPLDLDHLSTRDQ